MVGNSLKGKNTRNLVVGLLLAVTVAGGLVANHQVSGSAGVLGNKQNLVQLQSATTATVPYLGPFARNAKKGKVCGPEVRLMEGALRLTTPPIRTSPASNCIGIATERQLKKFQIRHDIPPSGIYGLRTHKVLEHAYTKRQRADLAYIAALQLRKLRYDTIGIIVAHSQALQSRMQYCDYGSLSSCGRRWNWPAWPDVPHNADCSSWFEWIYFEAGLPDPSGLGFRGGYTQTIARGGVPVPPNGPLKIGDAILNGPSASNTTHVSIYIGRGLSAGHGRAGIQIHIWNYRAVVAVRRFF